jgi:hypothetical protein
VHHISRPVRNAPRSLLAFGAGLALSVAAFAGVAAAVTTTSVPCTGDTLADGTALLDAVNAHGDGDTISLAAGCTYTLDTAGFASFSDALTLQGNGATITRSAAGGTPEFRFFDVESGGDLTVVGTTLSNGVGGDGGAIFTSDASTTIINSTFAGNQGGDGGALAFEGGNGTETIIGSTFTANSADTDGGALHNDVTLVVVNSTFTANTAPEGAAYFNNGGTSASFTNVTVSGNTTTSEGGAFQNGSGTTTASNTIVAGNTGGNCGSETIVDGGHNLEDGTTCGFADHAVNGEPALGSLQNNGGPTQTMAIAATSPAHEAASLAICTASLPSGAEGIDQRGLPRAPVGAESACDIGAFELQSEVAPVTPVTPAAPVPVAVTPAFTG